MNMADCWNQLLNQYTRVRAVTHSTHMRWGFARNLSKGYSTASMVSDGRGPVDMPPLGEVGPDGKTKRASASTNPDISAIEFVPL